MLIALLTISAALFLLLYLGPTSHRRHMYRCAEKIPGAKPLPIVGNVFEFGLNFDKYVPTFLAYLRKYGKLTKAWIGPYLVVFVADPLDVELVLSSKKHMHKGFVYKFLEPWLGTGLLISSGEKWHTRRKFLTSTFHFKMLEQYVDVFNDQAEVLVKELLQKCGRPFDVCPYIEAHTHRVICETAMGEKTDTEELREKNKHLLETVKTVSEIFIKRIQRPWYYGDFLFQFSSLRRVEEKCINVLQANTKRVIAERKEILKNIPQNNEETILDVEGGKMGATFLDHLLLTSQGGTAISDEGIREEVDTFMLEGHETVSSALSFALYLLSVHQEIQQKLFEEIKRAMNDTEKPRFTMDQLNELKYSEMVIKETLRLYPSVPWYSRALKEDLHLSSKNVTVPAGSELVVCPYAIHMSEDIFPDPKKFDPQRFTQEADRDRHPFAYIPFSAGLRNCIGQKFAMLEMKSTLSKIIWNFKILPDDTYAPYLILGLALKAKNGVRIYLQKRQIA